MNKKFLSLLLAGAILITPSMNVASQHPKAIWVIDFDMKKITLLLLMAAAGYLFYKKVNRTIFYSTDDCITDAGTIEKKQINIENIDKIDAKNRGNLFIHVDPDKEETLIIEAGKNILHCLNATTTNNKLNIYASGSFSTRSPINYYATVKSLTDICLSNSINTEVKGTTKLAKIKISNESHLAINHIKNDSLHIDASNNSTLTINQPEVSLLNFMKVSDSSKVTLNNVNTDSIQATLRNKGSITLTGKTNTQTINLSNNSEYNAATMISNTTNAKLSNASSATVRAECQLTYDMSNYSCLQYYGNCTTSGKEMSASRLIKLWSLWS